jgi:hypothetical protein
MEIPNFLTPTSELRFSAPVALWRGTRAIGRAVSRRIYNYFSTPAPVPQLLNDFKMQTQCASEWCWAAAAVSTADYYCRRGFAASATNLTQCRVASRATPALINCCQGENTADCTKSAYPKGCNIPSYLDQALDFIGGLPSDKGLRDFAIQFEEAGNEASIQAQIKHGRPIGCLIRWAGAPARYHYIMIVGWFVDSSGHRLVYVHDPQRETGAPPLPYRYEKVMRGYVHDGQEADIWETTVLTQPINRSVCLAVPIA